MKSGFTKKDTIVTIISVGFLLMNLAAVQQRGREQAKMIVCQANLKMIGQAQFQYLDDNENRFPIAWESLVESEYTVSGYERYCRWHDSRFPPDGPLFIPYIENKKVLLCPTFNTISKQFGQYHPAHDSSIPIIPQYSYSMNGLLGYGPSSPNRSGGGAITRSEVTRNPAEVFFFAEENIWGRAGYSYALNDNALCGFGYDWFGTFHNTNADNLNAGTINTVFVDGHVQQVTSALKDDYKDTSEMEFGRFEKYCWPHQDKVPTSN